ncbi:MULTISPECIES: histidine phosphatase family protein [unclassified Neorhizobium]|uniref:histidine phosphatase family protein n=1 Tax=unclassified Neorhizobium TaxID=2629175 RepID=UPI001FF2595E|nr:MULTISPECIES: histidine phosphatase family protein [unclassified Neorhizobium]MCJ9670385.1 histidine phosphatase family protein [Neorhizobium sp. SHOUNA12B]MCJ9746302.1 histidine phosphatase family protein [Neorhizobium sp. SHOUNA12A]
MAPSWDIYREDYFGAARAALPTNLKSFFSLRHGQTELNARGLAQGHTDVSLDGTGREQALAARPVVEGLQIAGIVVSPFLRAKETADIVNERKRLNIIVEDGFKERDYGIYGGRKPPADLYTKDLPTTQERENFSFQIANAMHHFTKENMLLCAHGDINRLLIGLFETNVTHREDFGNAQLLYFKKTIAGWKVINLSAQRIASIKPLEVIDSAGRPIVQVTITTERGAKATEAAPTGTTVGAYEPSVLRDGDPARYNGLGVRKAVQNIETILTSALMGMNVFDQAGIDQTMLDLDGTSDLSKLGGNAIGSISAAVYRCAAASMEMDLYEFAAGGRPVSLPIPIFNIVNGVRGGGRDDLIYEHIIVPHGASNYAHAVQMGVDIHRQLGKVIELHLGKKPSVGASGGYSAPSPDPHVVFGLMQEAVDKLGCTDQVAFAFDCAASDVFKDGAYPWNGKRLSAAELIPYYKGLADKFPFVFMEDLFDENDFDSFAMARREIPNTVIIGDDLTVTNIGRMEEAFQRNAIGGFLFKPGQAGTVTGAMKALAFAAEKRWMVAASARGGGPTTDIVRDISLGTGKVQFYKAGAPLNGGHRTVALCEGIEAQAKWEVPLADVSAYI